MNPNTMNHIIGSTKHARDKHPDFADNICHALCLAQEEMGEVAKAIKRPGRLGRGGKRNLRHHSRFGADRGKGF